jgi:hypothetical protein
MKESIMQTQSSLQRPGRVALRYGSIFGVALGLIQSAISFVSQSLTTQNGSGTSNQPIIEFLFLVAPVIWVIGFLIAGTLSAKRTGGIGIGALAGLFAGIFGGIIAAVAEIAISTFSVQLPASGTPSATLALFGEIVVPLYTMVLAFSAGAGFGALGGLMGQALSPVRYQPPTALASAPYPPPQPRVPAAEVIYPPQLPRAQE